MKGKNVRHIPPEVFFRGRLSLGTLAMSERESD